jgi:hypothetical protein
MEMVIRRVQETVNIMLHKDEDRGDVDILVDGCRVAYFTIGIGKPVLRICRKALKETGFQSSTEEF